MRGPHSERDSGPFQEANGIYTDFLFLPGFPDLCFLYILCTYTARPRGATRLLCAAPPGAGGGGFPFRYDQLWILYFFIIKRA